MNGTKHCTISSSTLLKLNTSSSSVLVWNRRTPLRLEVSENSSGFLFPETICSGTSNSYLSLECYRLMSSQLSTLRQCFSSLFNFPFMFWYFYAMESYCLLMPGAGIGRSSPSTLTFCCSPSMMWSTRGNRPYTSSVRAFDLFLGLT